jgi:hypothetical protein
MKFFTALLIALHVGFLVDAQDKRGYVGVNIGRSYVFNVNRSERTFGANINLVNAGYSFKNNLGITLKWMGAAHIPADNNKFGYGAIFIGPMYSVLVAENTFLDLKFATGLFWMNEKFKSVFISPDFGTITSTGEQSWSSWSLTNFAAGLTLRYHFAKSWSALALAEYNSGKTNGDSYFIRDKHLNALTLNAGVAVRF